MKCQLSYLELITCRYPDLPYVSKTEEKLGKPSFVTMNYADKIEIIEGNYEELQGCVFQKINQTIILKVVFERGDDVKKIDVMLVKINDFYKKICNQLPTLISYTITVFPYAHLSDSHCSLSKAKTLLDAFRVKLKDNFKNRFVTTLLFNHRKLVNTFSEVTGKEENTVHCNLSHFFNVV